MKTRNIKEISKKVYSFIIGLLLCLIALSLSLNAGYVAKAISFPFVYLLGMASYLFYALIFAEGISLMVAKATLKIPFNKYLLFGFIAFVGLVALLTYFYIDQSTLYLSFKTEEGSISFYEQYNFVFGSIPSGENTTNYFIKDAINPFAPDNQFGCGLLGYVLLTLGNSIFASKVGGLVFAILFLTVGVCLIVVPFAIKQIQKMISKKKSSGPKQKEAKQSRIKNVNIIKDAKYVDPKTYHSEVSGAGKNVENFGVNTPKHNENESSYLEQPFFKEKSLEEHIKEEMPEAQQLNEFEDVVFDAPESKAPSYEKKDVFEEVKPQINVEPIETNPSSEDVAAFNIEKEETQDNSFECIQEENETTEFTAPIEEPVTIEEPKQEEVRIEEPVKEKRPRVNWIPMTSELLNSYDTSYAIEINSKTAEDRKVIINNTFGDFGIGAEVVDYTIGPSITRFNIRYNSNVSSKSVANMIQDISIRLNGVSARFESVIEGQSTSGLEIPNAEITTVGFKDVFDALPTNLKKHPLAVAFGKNIKGDVIFADYDEFPHMLVSGTTGSGKSVFVNSIICTLIMRNSPDDLKLVLVDPKKVEMSRYADMPHLLTPIITEPMKVKLVLDKLVEEMEERYSLFSKNNATNIKEYNEDCEENGNERMPYIVVVLDEYADLVEQCKEISFPVVMLAQKARACGIHLMLSTQRPSTNVVTGVIKANMPTHVALMCASSVDSITIIGEGGAEKLLGKGDMLVQSPLVSRVGVCRLQSCYIDRKEIIKLVTDIKSKYETYYDEKYLNLEEKKASENVTSEYQDSGEGDEESRYQGIKEWVMTQEFMSMSKIQRDCGVGFNRAGRFFARLQKEGIVGAVAESNKGCRVLIQDKFGDDENFDYTSEDNSYIK